MTVRTPLDEDNVAAILSRARELTLPAMRDAVEHLAPPSAARVAGYHIGWLDADGSDSPGGLGKGIRYTLALLAAEGAGAAIERGIPGGVAVELVHNFSMLHDDLMDGDEERHHRRTAWTIFGSSAAILGGVALLTLAERVLLDLHTPEGADAAKLLTDTTARLVTGQTDDIEFESRDDVTLDECVRMVSNKTAALISASAAIGAILAGAPPTTVRELTDFGEDLGIAFQAVDDLLGIWGSHELTGKPVLSDLRTGKKSLPVTAALAAGGPAATELAGLLNDKSSAQSEDRLAREAELIETTGGRRWTEQEAERRLGSAHQHLAAAALSPAATNDIAAIADFVVWRQR